MTTYKFIGDAYLSGCKLNVFGEQFNIEKTSEKDISIRQAFSNILFNIKQSALSYRHYNTSIPVKNSDLVLVDGTFWYNDEIVDINKYQLYVTLQKIIVPLDDTYTKFTFYKVPEKVEQLYFRAIIGKDEFTDKELFDAALKPNNYRLFYNDKPVSYTEYHVNKTFKSLEHEGYSGFFIYNDELKCYTKFENIICVKEIPQN